MTDPEWSIGLVHTGRVWDAGLTLGEQKLVGEHLAYLGRLIQAGEVTRAGTVIEADHGPAEDGFVGLIVYAVGAARAQQLADNDPAVRGGMIGLRIHPWYAGV